MNKNGIIKSSIIVTVLTFGIKLLGLIKQSVLAASCGATIETDAFFIATGVIVQLCSVLFSSLSITFLSFHTEIYVKNGKKAANCFVNAVLRCFIPVAVVLSCFFFWLAPVMAYFLAPSYSFHELMILTYYIRIMSCAFVFWCYALILNAVLESEKRFIPGKGLSFFQNLFLVIAALFFFPYYGMDCLVYAFLFSGFMQCIVVTICAKNVFHVMFGKAGYKTEIKQLLFLSVPLILGNAIYEINDIVDKKISTSLGSGNVSFLTYGGSINEIVTGVIVSSVSTVIFAHYASWVANGEFKKVEDNLKSCICVLSILIFPIMVMCIACGDSLITILYSRGNFKNDEVISTYYVVIGYAVGFVFQAARANIVKVFYAFKDTKRPMINGVISVATNIVLSIILSNKIGIMGIALATSIAMLLSTILLICQIKTHLPKFSIIELIPELVKGGSGAIVSVFMVLLSKKIVVGNCYFVFLIEGIICVSTYYICLKFMHSLTCKQIEQRLLEIVKKKKE